MNNLIKTGWRQGRVHRLPPWPLCRPVAALRRGDRVTNYPIILACCDAHSTSATGQNPNVSRTLECQLWPAADMPSRALWTAVCQVPDSCSAAKEVHRLQRCHAVAAVRHNAKANYGIASSNSISSSARTATVGSELKKSVIALPILVPALPSSG